MSDKKKVISDPVQGKGVMSIAAVEAYRYLNAGVRVHYRGSGDTPTAARNRAAKDAGISPAQAERIWKRWKTMASVDGDVYRALRNRYEAICHRIESAADGMDQERREIEEANEVRESRPAIVRGMAEAAKGAAQSKETGVS